MSSNGIVTTSDAVHEELLGLTKQMPNSPLAELPTTEVVLSDGRLVSKQDEFARNVDRGGDAAHRRGSH